MSGEKELLRTKERKGESATFVCGMLKANSVPHKSFIAHGGRTIKWETSVNQHHQLV